MQFSTSLWVNLLLALYAASIVAVGKMSSVTKVVMDSGFMIVSLFCSLLNIIHLRYYVPQSVVLANISAFHHRFVMIIRIKHPL